MLSLLACNVTEKHFVTQFVMSRDSQSVPYPRAFAPLFVPQSSENYFGGLEKSKKFNVYPPGSLTVL